MTFTTELEREDFLSDVELVGRHVHDLTMTFVDVTSDEHERLWTPESMQKAALFASTKANEFLRIIREQAEAADVAAKGSVP